MDNHLEETEMNENKIIDDTKRVQAKPRDYTQSAKELSKRATEKSNTFTRSIIERSKKLRTPSAKVDKIGREVGEILSIGLILYGTFQMFGGKPYGVIGMSIGAVSLISNHIYRNK